ncbi:MAG: hypothetical protein K9G46_07090 [Flavobacteriales bacterium]|jgi:hypothetical protein|nr:hypothetical protein [Flavobacteriales bacterium]
MAQQPNTSDNCKGWDVFVGVFGSIWDGVAGAAGAGAFQGMVPSSGCGPQNVYVREHVYDHRAGMGVAVTLATLGLLVFVGWGALKAFNYLKK